MKNNAELIICIIAVVLIMYVIYPVDISENEPEINSFHKVLRSHIE